MTEIDVTLTVAGIARGITATVYYEHLPAERGSREKGSGIQLEPDYPESVEIADILVDGRTIHHLFSDAQLKAISYDILESV